MDSRSNQSPEISLPEDWVELVEKAQRGNCVLFLGSDSPRGFTHGIAPPSSSEVTAALLERLEYTQGGTTLPDVAQAYQYRFGRNSLVERIKRLAEGSPRYRPQETEKLIANLPFHTILTTRYDTLLEEALTQIGTPPEVIVNNTEVPYLSTEKPLLIKLHGCITRPGTLVLTQRDVLGLNRRLETILNLVRYLFVTKHLLFVDHNLDDFEFQILLNEVVHTVGIHHRRVFAVWSPYPTNFAISWPDVNIAILEDMASGFFRKLGENFRSHIETHVAIERPRAPLSKPPYKFLDYFTRWDNDIFFGRDAEILYCWRRILSHQIVTIFGPSGAGKTSLFLAGIIPQLELEGFQVITVRPLSDPLLAIKESLAAQLHQSSLQTGTLVELASELADKEKKLVIALDQYEEVFLSVGTNARRQLYTELAEITSRTELDIRFVFILREDFLALLDEARDLLPGVFTNSYRVSNLSHIQALAAIVEPAKMAGIEVEPDLLTRLLQDLDEGGIAPPQLQILCHHLYLDCVSKAEGSSAVFENAGRTLTLESYDALGGATQVLAHYLDAALDLIEYEDGPILKAAIIEVLKIMVSSQQTKLALSENEVEQMGSAKRLPAEVVKRALSILVNKRLARRFERAGLSFFELAHDYLGRHIAEWISEDEWRSKRAREMIVREVTNWHEVGSLIPRERFRLLNSLREDITHLQNDEAELLFLCAFEYGIDQGFWLQRAEEAGWNVDQALELILSHSDMFVRARAIEHIGSLEKKVAVPWLLDLTHDLDAKIREKTVEQLAKLLAREAIPELARLLTDPYPSVRWRSAQALLDIGTYPAIKALEGYWPKDMLLVEECSCIIGSNMKDIERHIQATGSDYFLNESPSHEVFIDTFLIDRFLVTNEEYQKFVEATGHPPPPHWIEGKVIFGEERHPVSQVSFSDACAYAAWAGKRLPTEYEWEKAASWDPERGQKRLYPWGDEFDVRKCHVGIHAGRSLYVPVGQYSPKGDSPYGMADAIGNGWEWVDGYFEPYPGASYSDENYGKKYRIQRSCGGWDNEESHSLHVTHRVGMPDVANAEVTFRCAMDIPSYLAPYLDKQREGHRTTGA